MATQLHPASPMVPPAAVTRILGRFDRHQLEGFIAIAIDLLDVADGDLDLEDDDPAEDSEVDELDGDESDGNYSEDDFAHHGNDGPGCPVSDPGGGAADDVGEDGPPDEQMLAEHLSRIRRTRCLPEYRRWRDWGGGIRSEVQRYRLWYHPKIPTRRQLLKRKRGVPRRPRG